MTRTTLTTGWTLELGSGPRPDGLPGKIPATVPGCVHTDLLDNDLIPDPYLDRNENEVQWIGETDATYSTVFDFVDGGHERVDIVAEGLDTVATVRVNGGMIGRKKNQHRSYRLDARAALVPGENELVVAFDAPLRAARESEERIGAKPLVDDALPYNALRKMASNFGWDWGPTLTTAGIWKPIHVHQWSTARLARVLPEVTVDERGRGRIDLRIDLERTGDEPVDLAIDLIAPDGSVTSAARTTSDAAGAVSLTVDRPELWWPRGYGDQPLYDLSVRASSNGQELDSWSHAIGFRSLDVRIQPDEHGTSFEFHVNGQFVWARGANWIPADCFPSRMTRERYASKIQDAVDADMNMLRVWGGGIYESEDFYDLCNREGILIWQDFAFACAVYSEAPEMWAEVEAEARENVARLAPNPALALWNGSNENIEGYFHWGFKERLGEGEAWGGGYYNDLLPAVIADLDPQRAYIPSSPWSPDDYSDPRNPDHGPVHSWKVWFSEDYLVYRDAIPRFVPEFGFQGPPNYATLTGAVHDDPLTPRSPAMLTHQKAVDGNEKFERGWAPHLPDPTSFDDWHFTTQLNQVRAISCAVSHYRSHAPRNAGYLVWQLNDCWAGMTWAMVDGDGRRKPLWYALRALNAPRLVMLQPRENGATLIASNESPEPWVDTVEVQRRHVDGRVLATERFPIEVPPRSSATFPLDDEVRAPAEAGNELLVAHCASASGGRRAWWWFVEDLALALPKPSLRAEVRRTELGYDLELTAETLLKDLVLNIDRLDPAGTVSDQLITLLPGETYTFSVASRFDPDPQALSSHPVLQSAGHLAHPAAKDDVA